mmetsp:Transcript_134444/g.287629  ORF Transcript_134444/g.287629 Transcript_134444/m.287629 type:complete len:344 (+) Transcript_134444:112-1143(+)
MFLCAGWVLVQAMIVQQVACEEPMRPSPQMQEMMKKMEGMAPHERLRAMHLMGAGAGGMGNMRPETQMKVMNAVMNRAGMAGGLEAAMSGKPSRPKEPRQITMKTARKYIKYLLAVLTTEEAKAALQEAREKADDRNDEGALMKAVAPVVESLVKDLTAEYGFTDGFEDGMTAVGAAMGRKGDKKLRKQMEDVSELLTGKTPHTRVGRIPELDVVAEQFIDMSLEDKKAAILVTEKKQEEASADSEMFDNTGAYLDAMRGIVKHGSSYSSQQVVEILTKLVGKPRDSATSKRINVLTMFFGKGDLQHVEQAVQKLQIEFSKAQGQAQHTATKASTATPRGDEL